MPVDSNPVRSRWAARAAVAVAVVAAVVVGVVTVVADDADVPGATRWTDVAAPSADEQADVSKGAEPQADADGRTPSTRAGGSAADPQVTKAAFAVLSADAGWKRSSAREWVRTTDFAVVAVDRVASGPVLTAAVSLRRVGDTWIALGAAPATLVRPSRASIGKADLASASTSTASNAALSTSATRTSASALRGVGATSFSAVPVADGDPDVGGDPDAGAIVGTGSLLLPRTFDGDPEARHQAANCEGCLWRVELACGWSDDSCQGAYVGCPPAMLRYLVMLQRPPATEYSMVGTICRGPGDELLGADEAAQRVRDRFLELLPRAEPTVQPSNGSLVNLPTIFAAGEPRTMGPVDFDLAGYAIDVTAEVEWTWRFGDGGTLVTAEPGGRYPNRSVSHTYRQPGRHDVVLTSRWLGEFTIDGAGPFPIAGGPIELDAALEVQVNEARAQLVSP